MFLRWAVIFIIGSAALLSSCSKSTTPKPPPVEENYSFDGSASWSPDQRYIYYCRRPDDLSQQQRYGEYSIWAIDMQTLKYGFLVGPGVAPEINPQSTIMAFSWAYTIYFYYLDTKRVRQVTHGYEAMEFHWSPSGDKLIITPGDGIVIDTSGNILSHLIPWDRSNGGWYGGWEGNWFKSGTPGWENRIIISSRDSQSRSGILILDTLGQIIDTVIIDDQPHADLAGYNYPAISPDQSGILVSYDFIGQDGIRDSDFRLLSRDGGLISILSPRAGTGRWSPDGSRIAFQKYIWMGDSPTPDLYPDYYRITIWICNADGSEMHELLGWPQPEPDPDMFDGGYNWVTDTYRP
jgi:Tol biopolymer transport system component